jgi:hypothetical protein
LDAAPTLLDTKDLASGNFDKWVGHETPNVLMFAVCRVCWRGAPEAATSEAVATSGEIDPAIIRFTQNSISSTFRDGGSVADLARRLQAGAVNPYDIPPIRLVEHQGNLFSLDNRRLVAFQQAGVNVPFRMATAEEIGYEWAKKFTTQVAGSSVQLRFVFDYAGGG